jgi:hypothetical protein
MSNSLAGPSSPIKTFPLMISNLSAQTGSLISPEISTHSQK